jgi:hypothetical protein
MVLREKDDRAARAQQRAVLWYGSDMMNSRKSCVNQLMVVADLHLVQKIPNA